MADVKKTLHIDIFQNVNQKSENYGHFYPRAVRINTLNTRGLAEHMASHGSLYTYDVINGVLTAFSKCLIELLAEGTAVKLDSIGTFYSTVKSVEGGAENLDSAKELGAEALVDGVHVRFWPDGTKLDAITSKEMKKRCSLKLRNQVIITQIKEGNKVVKRTHQYIPIEETGTPAPEPEP